MRLLLLVLSLACAPINAQELDWDDLVPGGWEPYAVYDKLVKEIYGDTPVEEITDEDTRGNKLLDAIDKAWREAPLVTALDNRKVSLPGYTVPLEGDSEYLREFLLVPYFGACIHTPPPPRNQIVLVRMQNKGIPIDVALEPMWIDGTLKVTPEDTEYGTAGYLLEGTGHEVFAGY